MADLSNPWATPLPSPSPSKASQPAPPSPPAASASVPSAAAAATIAAAPSSDPWASSSSSSTLLPPPSIPLAQQAEADSQDNVQLPQSDSTAEELPDTSVIERSQDADLHESQETTNEDFTQALTNPPGDSLDDDDDFDFQDATQNDTANSADFDDFGDFDDGGFEAPAPAGADIIADQAAPPASTQSESAADTHTSQSSWNALPDPLTLSHDELVSHIRQLLAPALSSNSTHKYPYHSGALASGSIQPASSMPIKPKTIPHSRTGVLATTPGAQGLWDDLVNKPPKGYKPVSWNRSGARRRLYTALGIPINLDEELPPALAGTLPPLKISLGGSTSNESPSSPAQANGKAVGALKGRGPGSNPNSGRSTPQPAPQRSSSGSAFAAKNANSSLPPPPPLDMARVQAILKLSPTQLSLLPLSALRSLSSELQSHTSATSASLAHYLQKRDTLASDADTYNTMIKDLVAGAASRLASGGGGSRNSTGGGSPTVASGAAAHLGAKTPRSSTPLGR
ncbi:hypothetical protein OC845_000728 [Tilletia horrida]|nr:hypothetical protein OC845_000728 [Tilletia horrida]